jgi:hypothetical protein
MWIVFNQNTSVDLNDVVLRSSFLGCFVIVVDHDQGGGSILVNLKQHDPDNINMMINPVCIQPDLKRFQPCQQCLQTRMTSFCWILENTEIYNHCIAQLVESRAQKNPKKSPFDGLTGHCALCIGIVFSVQLH